MGEAGDIIRASRKKKLNLAETKALAQKKIASRQPKKAAPKSVNKFEQTFQAGSTAAPKAPEEEKGYFGKVAEQFKKKGVGGVLKQAGKDALGYLKSKPVTFGKEAEQRYTEAQARGESDFTRQVSSFAVGGLLSTATAQVGSGLGKNGAWIPAKELKASQLKTALPTIGKEVVEEYVDDGLSYAGQFASNTKTVKQTSTMLAKMIGAGKKHGPFVVKALVATLGSYAWAAHLRGDNVVGTLSIAERDARMAGNEEAAIMAGEMLDEYLDPSLWEKIIQATPVVNVISAVKDIYDATKANRVVNKKVTDDLIFARENGLDDDAIWAKRREEQNQMELDRIAKQDEVIRQRAKDLDEAEIKQEQLKIDLHNADKAEDARIELAAIKEQIDLYNKDAAADKIKDAEDRQAVADFWLAYDKEKRKAIDSQRPSNLKFGLL